MVDAWRLVRCGSYTHAKSEIVLDCENVVIGRNVEPKYRLDSVNISRQHACLRYSRHGQWEITDLRSHNGVFVNGRKIQASHRFALHEGDIIGFGKPTPTGDDVFVFALEKKSAGVVVKRESPDSPRAASPGLDAVVLSDDDDIVVTKVVIANRRPTVSTSSDCAPVASTPLTTTLPAAPPHVTTKKEPVDEDDSLGYGVSEALTSQAVGAAHIDVAATADTTCFKSSPRHQVTGTTFTTSSKTVPSEAAGRVKIERDCDSTDSRSSCSRDTQHSRLSVPVVLTAAANNSPTATLPALPPHAPRTYIKQEVPEHAAGIGSVPVCEPGDVSRFIKQDPDDLDREKARNVQGMVVTGAHQSEFRSDVLRHDIVRSVSKRTELASTVSREDEANSCHSSPSSCRSEHRSEHHVLHQSNPDVHAKRNENTSAHSLPPRTDFSSITVKEEPSEFDMSSNMMQSTVESHVLMNGSIPSRSIEKAAQSGFTSGSRKASDTEQSSMFQHENKKNERCSNSKYVPCEERPHSPKVSSLPKTPKLDLSLLVKPCRIVLEKLEGNILARQQPVAPLSGQHLVKSSLDTELDHSNVEAELSHDSVNTTNEGSPCDMSFSQDDVIIILSDSDDDCNLEINLDIKKEAEEAEEIISNDADIEAGIPWINGCLNDITEEAKAVCSVTEDENLEKRLVWNESEPEQATSGKEQPENDFFPVLSQGFSQEEVAPAEIKGRGSAAREIYSSSFNRFARLGGRVNRSPKKKSSLKEKVMKSMNHRIPMAGGGSAVQKKDGEMLPKSSSLAECEDSSKRSHYKGRFQSRWARLLSTEEPSKPAASASKRQQGRMVKLLNDIQTAPNKVKATTSLGSPTKRARLLNQSRGITGHPAKEQASNSFDVSTEAVKQSNQHPFVAQPLQDKALEASSVSIERTNQWCPSSNATDILPQLKNAPMADSIHAETENRLKPSLEERGSVPQVDISTRVESSVQQEVGFSVPKFKQAVRISRVAKGSPVYAATASDLPINTQMPGVVPQISVLMNTSAPLDTYVPMDTSVPMGQFPEPMDVDEPEKRSRVHFHIEEPSSRTDEQRAEFAQRVRASLKKRKVEQSQRNKINLGVFISNILNWKVQWLKEQLQSSVLPPLLDMDKFRAKRLMYSNLEEYKLVNYQFLCLEVWQIVFRNWREYFAQTKRMTFSSAVVHHTCPPGDTMILTCVVLVTPEQMHRSLYPTEGNLVRLDLRIRDQPKAAMPVFGFVTQHKLVRDPRSFKSAIPDLLQNVYTDGCAPVTLKVQVRARPVTLDFRKVQRLSVVSKITPTLRQMEAVFELEKSVFVESIVRPNVCHFWCRKGVPMRSRFKENFNIEQEQVISSAVDAMRVRGSEPRIIILHGPPGTGKTHTLVGMVTEILHHNSRQTMLIVAPSNAAVDEIGRRLLAHRQQQYKQKVPTEQVLKVVRVGQTNKVHPEVRGICLEELLQKNIQKDENERCRECDMTICALETEMKQCADKKHQLDRSASRDVRASRRLEFQINHLRAQIQQAKEKKKLITDSNARQFRNVNDRNLLILRNAHVILSTLNSCRSRLMEEAFGRNSSHNFSCVLLDEATQCTEVEALLSLQYQTSKLILVGDPMQLPATVMSQDAADRGFQESLFERFYNYLNQEADPKPIFTLNEQRRMHSEICWFPSNYFYGGKLRPVVGLDAKYAPFPLIPYLVFNIEDSPEASEGTSTSWLNHGEAAFVAHLCLAISRLVGDASLGVITPYQAQKAAITEQLQESFAPTTATFDVNTVDGFQGQERDVIVLSCVRAYNPRGNIGFVADARRLNVAITRARKALYICGHLDSLKDSDEWKALISDAYCRSKVRDISAKCSSDLLANIIKKPCVSRW